MNTRTCRVDKSRQLLVEAVSASGLPSERKKNISPHIQLANIGISNVSRVQETRRHKPQHVATTRRTWGTLKHDLSGFSERHMHCTQVANQRDLAAIFAPTHQSILAKGGDMQAFFCARDEVTGSMMFHHPRPIQNTGDQSQLERLVLTCVYLI